MATTRVRSTGIQLVLSALSAGELRKRHAHLIHAHLSQHMMHSPISLSHPPVHDYPTTLCNSQIRSSDRWSRFHFPRLFLPMIPLCFFG
jgi:hypothetical protein